MGFFHYSKNFILTDPETQLKKSLADFGGQKYNPDSKGIDYNLLPDIEHITDSNDNLDGERYVKSVYGTRIIQVPIFLSEKNDAGDLFELRKWLCKKRQQIFSWEDDDENKEIDVIYKQAIDMNIYYGREFNAVFTLNFIAHNPYWRLKHELPYVRKGLTSGNILKIKNKGNANCYPLIKITPNGTQSTIKFNFNDLQVTLSNVDKPFYIDCELERCYEIINGEKKISLTKYVSDKYGNFPYMWYEMPNVFNLIEGNIAELNIEFRTRII